MTRYSAELPSAGFVARGAGYGFVDTVTVALMPRSGSPPRPSMRGRKETLYVPGWDGTRKCTTNQPT